MVTRGVVVSILRLGVSWCTACALQCIAVGDSGSARSRSITRGGAVDLANLVDARFGSCCSSVGGAFCHLLGHLVLPVHQVLSCGCYLCVGVSAPSAE